MANADKEAIYSVFRDSPFFFHELFNWLRKQERMCRGKINFFDVSDKNECWRGKCVKTILGEISTGESICRNSGIQSDLGPPFLPTPSRPGATSGPSSGSGHNIHFSQNSISPINLSQTFILCESTAKRFLAKQFIFVIRKSWIIVSFLYFLQFNKKCDVSSNEYVFKNSLFDYASILLKDHFVVLHNILISINPLRLCKHLPFCGQHLFDHSGRYMFHRNH